MADSESGTVGAEQQRKALDMAHHELTRLGNALNWENPIDQRTADAVNGLRWIKGEAEWPPASLAEPSQAGDSTPSDDTPCSYCGHPRSDHPHRALVACLHHGGRGLCSCDGFQSVGTPPAATEPEEGPTPVTENTPFWRWAKSLEEPEGDPVMGGEPEARSLSDEWATWVFAGLVRFYEWNSNHTLGQWVEDLDFDAKKRWCNAASIMPALAPSSVSEGEPVAWIIESRGGGGPHPRNNWAIQNHREDVFWGRLSGASMRATRRERERQGWETRVVPLYTRPSDSEGARDALGKVRIALAGFGDGSLARIAKDFDMGSEEWAVIHNADESIALALAAVAALASEPPGEEKNDG